MQNCASSLWDGFENVIFTDIVYAISKNNKYKKKKR